MADLSVPYVTDQATKGMEEGKPEVSRQHMSAPTVHYCRSLSFGLVLTHAARLLSADAEDVT